jgi:hypothetical protein
MVVGHPDGGLHLPGLGACGECLFQGRVQLQGYLLEHVGLGPKLNGPWTFANLGVIVALVLPFVLYLLWDEASSAARSRDIDRRRP